jgi:hypothetical protein
VRFNRAAPFEAAPATVDAVGQVDVEDRVDELSAVVDRLGVRLGRPQWFAGEWIDRGGGEALGVALKALGVHQALSALCANSRTGSDGRAEVPYGAGLRQQSPRGFSFPEPSDGLETLYPLLTMRPDRQLVAASGNGIGLFELLLGLSHLPPVASGCDRSAP